MKSHIFFAANNKYRQIALPMMVAMTFIYTLIPQVENIDLLNIEHRTNIYKKPTSNM